jgi:hypothetical protein
MLFHFRFLILSFSLKKRLSNDFGFEVALKYEDKDGDWIILSSQNDLNDIFEYHDPASQSDTINVTVGESTALPQLTLKSVGRGVGGGNFQAGNTDFQPILSVSRDYASVDPLSRGNVTSSGGIFPSSSTSSLMTSGGGIFGASQQRASSSSQQQHSHHHHQQQLHHRFPSINESSNNYRYPNQQQTTNPIRWKQGEILGQGAFGIVYLGLNIDTGELMAVKQMATDEVSRRELSSLENEINLVRNLKHSNIVRYIGTELTPSSLSIFLEYVPGGSLKTLIDKFGSLEESVAKSYTRQLLLGLEYLHRNGIAHRDIKGANCLVGNDGVIKLADFGNSKHWRPSASEAAAAAASAAGNGGGGDQRIQSSTGDIKGTPAWIAPEVIRDQGRNINWKKADIWSLASTTLEMTTGRPPWSQFNNNVTILYHLACQETLPEYPSPASTEVTACRFSLSVLISFHPFFVMV